ncbi:MAG: ABC transporter permease [candidate division Zixibacteria bacterium]|nr:ABC transporter permease [candidate division Zixibacteria bacterium]
MTWHDLLAISTGNLWRMKLRSFLTISGVIIAIAAFVAMLSFGAGNQKLVREQYEQLGLFNTMQVYPPRKSNDDDTARTVTLNDATVAELAEIPGVNLAYPYSKFKVSATIKDTSFSVNAQALPAAVFATKLYSQLLAGTFYDRDSARQAVVTRELTDSLHLTPDSIIGQQLIISIKSASIDSGLAYILQNAREHMRVRLKELRFDSLLNDDYRKRIFYGEMNSAFNLFLEGYMNHRSLISDTLTICGVLDKINGHRLRIEPIIIPAASARRFSVSGFGDDPADLFKALQEGSFFVPTGDSIEQNYSEITLNLDPLYSTEKVIDSVEALGFRTFSFARQFKEISRFFFYFDLFLGIIGLIALITASLGIVNTMVMSIIERKREIGLMKSLGADEPDIRLLFLFESAMIGTFGATIGIIFGWLITRLASFIARIIMTKQGFDEIELFALPGWLILIAFLFGLLVSLVAGFYPASRAARVDPVEALRNE